MHERIMSLYRLTGEAIETARRVSVNLRPNVLDNLGLCGAIEWLIREFEQRTNIKCSLESAVLNLAGINKHHEASIFRITQEAFVNIAKHSRATAVAVELLENRDGLVITVKDNGIGITQSQLLNPGSFGIIGMNERMQQLGGKLEIYGSAEGSVVTLRIPLAATGLCEESIHD
jgi:two-component system sensor histidine kinase UhpB